MQRSFSSWRFLSSFHHHHHPSIARSMVMHVHSFLLASHSFTPHLHIPTTFIDTIKTTHHSVRYSRSGRRCFLIFLSFLFTILLIFRRVFLLTGLYGIGYSIIYGYRPFMRTACIRACVYVVLFVVRFLDRAMRGFLGCLFQIGRAWIAIIVHVCRMGNLQRCHIQ